MREHEYAVIIGGGTGARLWPLSRRAVPKQFHQLVGRESTIQLMHRMLAATFPVEKIYVQVPVRFAAIVREQLPALPTHNLLLEPSSRDTAPAFALATIHLLKIDPEATIGYFYADHIIKQTREFGTAITTAFTAVVKFPTYVAMIGIKPTFAHTGYGYIKTGREVKTLAGGVFRVARFIEKPALAEAEKMTRSWEYFWNTGYKVARGKLVLKLLQEYDAAMAKSLKKIARAVKQGNAAAITPLFDRLPKVSLEYLLTEKMKDLLLVPTDIEWQDIGDWRALYDILAETTGTTIVSRGNHVDYESDNCLVYANHRLIATVGLKDMIIVDAGDAVLVMNKSAAQDLKGMVTKLSTEHKQAYL